MNEPKNSVGTRLDTNVMHVCMITCRLIQTEPRAADAAEYQITTLVLLKTKPLVILLNTRQLKVWDFQSPPLS